MLWQKENQSHCQRDTDTQCRLQTLKAGIYRISMTTPFQAESIAFQKSLLSVDARVIELDYKRYLKFDKSARRPMLPAL